IYFFACATDRRPITAGWPKIDLSPFLAITAGWPKIDLSPFWRSPAWQWAGSTEVGYNPAEFADS
ncbi:MAG TPA: hypothetical protein VGL98_19300, partial [Gammaproteobacteria bacterium]